MPADLTTFKLDMQLVTSAGGTDLQLTFFLLCSPMPMLPARPRLKKNGSAVTWPLLSKGVPAASF